MSYGLRATGYKCHSTLPKANGLVAFSVGQRPTYKLQPILPQFQACTLQGRKPPLPVGHYHLERTGVPAL